MSGTGSTPPYLSLSVGQAHSYLKAPDAPEPADHGTLVALLKHRARHQANHVAVGFPDFSKGSCLEWTYRDLDRIASSLAMVLRAKLQDLPQSRESNGYARDQPVIALLGPSGPDFLAQVVACWYLGAAILPIATGTSPSGVANLLNLTACTHILVHESQDALVSECRASLDAHRELRSVAWCALDAARPCESKVVAESALLRDPKRDDLLVIFHSSGSSGNPKPIPQSHRFWTPSLLTADGRSRAAFTTTPLFHGGLSDLFRSLQAAAPLYFFGWHIGDAPTSANILSSVAACSQEVHYFLSVPFILEALSREEVGLNMLHRMDLVSTGGAPLPEAVGDHLVQHKVPLVSRLGSSECGFLMSSWRDFEQDKEWSWLRLVDGASREWLRWEQRPEEGGLYELVVTRDWPTKMVSNAPDGSFVTGDLYERHSSDETKWRYARRADDSLVLINGKKIASSPIENALKAIESIKDAIVFGANRPILGALIVPAASTSSREASSEADFLSTLAPALSTINRKLPSHGKLTAEMLRVVDAATFERLPKSSKGTLQRGMALTQLEAVIADTYDRFDKGEAPRRGPRVSLRGEQLRNWLRELVAEVTDHDIALEDDLYKSGMDSIMSARIRAALLQRLDLGTRRLPANVVYEQANIERLACFLEGASSDGPANVQDLASALVHKYSTFLPQPRTAALGASDPATILLTGGTGALGARVLEELILQPAKEVEAIYCLVRAQDDEGASARISDALKRRQCEVTTKQAQKRLKCRAQLDETTKADLSTARRLVVIHVSNSDRPRLFCPTSCTLPLQCAWVVNFALSLTSFEKDCISRESSSRMYSKHFERVSQLIARSAPARFVFSSSLASILAGAAPHREEPSEHVSSAGSTGYAQSKWVAEKICEAAGERVTIARVGQLCSDTKHGIWNESEAWPLLVRTADETGVLPATGPNLDWLPVDAAARALVDLALKQGEDEATLCHVCTPQSSTLPSWSDFIAWLAEAGLRFEVKSKEAWLDAVRRAGTGVRGRALVESIWANVSEVGESEGLAFDLISPCSLSASGRRLGQHRGDDASRSALGCIAKGASCRQRSLRQDGLRLERHWISQMKLQPITCLFSQ
ncbi:acetyl-CoA synthetase-like protein [Ceraceosorus guamensis]|uniref:Acetyl-CoA synthetase-like protein n=1 Tax=Ceraceosorus guamensis TaxID=1522189 RepID=A0A316WDP5_9BASI|nr:acetyl-CoA synthetase-like protein [Ceraceosorus guamensis]PWN45585.1 acetyl-CoA synthetase-like protein [Ceraceosorus guamensis]